jgi:hypothetical protein
MPSFK